MGHAILERVLLFGTRSADYIRASGHNGCTLCILPPSLGYPANLYSVETAKSIWTPRAHMCDESSGVANALASSRSTVLTGTFNLERSSKVPRCNGCGSGAVGIGGPYSTPSTIRKSGTAPSPSAFNAFAYAALS